MNFLGGSDAGADSLGALILATAALGTAAMGIVEALKWTALGEAGFSATLRVLGPLCRALRAAYGDGYESLLRAQYRGSQEDFARLLREGVRAGLSLQNAGPIADALGSIDRVRLRAAVRRASSGGALELELKSEMDRFLVAVDAHIDAALALARSRYAGTARVMASLVALTIAVVSGLLLGGDRLVSSFVVGLAAVPVAPIAKDLVSGFRTATSAVRASGHARRDRSGLP